MESNSKHLSDVYYDKKKKVDRSRLHVNVGQSSPVTNGLKSEIKVPREEKSQAGLENVNKSSVSPQKETSKTQEKPSLKRPAPSDDSDDDATLGERAKQMLASKSNTPSNKLEKSKPTLDSPSKNDIKKIKKIKPDSNSSASPKTEKAKKAENSDDVKQFKTDNGSATPNQADGIKKSNSESGSGIKKLKVDSGSPRTEGSKKSKSDSNTSSKPERIKKMKSESGVSSPSKLSESIKNIKQEGSSPVKSDGAKKIKREMESSVKMKSESGFKSPEGAAKKIKEEKEKLTSSSSQKGDGTRAKEGSSIKTDKDKSFKTDSQKTKECSRLNSPKSDGVKKEKQKTSSSASSKPENSQKSSDSTKQNKDSSRLTSSKVDGIKKEKQKSSSPVSSKPEGKVDGIKKEKQNVASTGSPKVDSLKKIKTEPGVSVSSYGEKKVGEKKIKTESSSGSAKSEKKSKSESNSSGTPKVKVEPGVKKVKTEGGSSSSPKVSSGAETNKTATDDSDDDVPLAFRSKNTGSSTKKSRSSKDRKRKSSDDDDDDDYKPLKKMKKKSDVGGKDTKKAKVKKEKDGNKTPEKGKEGKGKEKKEEEVWKWWEEEKHPEGIKWLTLEHKGPYFPPEYKPLPDSVNFYYDGKKVKLSLKSEEVAGFYAKMLDHDYTSKKIFNDNFFDDWRKEMTDEERALITKLSKCDFKEMHAYYVQQNEERKNMSKEEKKILKEKNEEILQEYGYCMMDNHKERVGNFKIEPPGLFRGRGDHPKQGKLKKRLKARDVTINIGKDAKVPDPPEGQRWKAVQHDNKVTWLACWIENIQGSYKYVMLNPTSRIKGEKDWQKYETARKLKDKIHKIREDYTNDWRAKEMRIRQRGVALYFIDKLALRAGHEKDEDTADTVGCCSLRYEHIKLHRKLGEKECVVEFDFLGKDSIHYHNFVEVEKKVFKNLELFQQGKSEGDDLFDRLSTTSLNKYLSELMEGLSAKVFRTYNASMTLQEQLNNLEVEDNVAAKVLGYNRANRAVAILCNHQRSVPKTFEQSMSNLQQKIDDKRKAIKDAKNELKDMKHELKECQSVTLTKKIEKKQTMIERLKEQLFKLEVSQTDKNENKEIALGTSKLNYLDPRISIAWCLKNDVPIEKIYNKTQRQKFAWAIDMTEEDFVF